MRAGFKSACYCANRLKLNSYITTNASHSSDIYFSILFPIPFFLFFFFLQNVEFVVPYKLRFTKEQLFVLIIRLTFYGAQKIKKRQKKMFFSAV